MIRQGLSCRDTHGWLRLVACCLMLFLRSLAFSIIGIFTVEFQEYFQWKTVAESSWLITCHMGPAVIISAVVVGYAVDRLGVQITLWACVLLGSGGFLLGAISNTISGLFIGYGFFAGCGLTSYNVIANTILQRSFGSKNNLSTGMAFTCMSLGSFIWPPLVRLSIDTYCWQGALILLAGANLHILPFLPILPRCSRKSEICEIPEEKPAEKDPLIPSDGNRNIPEEKHNIQAGDNQEPVSSRNMCLSGKGKMYGLLIIYSISQFLNAFPNYALFLYIPVRCVLQGFTKIEAVSLISIMSISSAALRLVAGRLGDVRCLNVFYIVGAGTAVCGLSLVLSPFCNTFLTLAVFAGIFGAGAAFFVTMSQAVVKMIGGVQELNVGLAMLYAAEGLCGFSFPLSSLLLDYVGDINLVFVVLGVSGLLGSFLVFATGLLHKYFVANKSRLS